MRLTKIRVRNYKSFIDSGEVRLEQVQALVGENNAGKSNMLHAIEWFLSAGTGGVSAEDVPDKDNPMVVESEFSELTQDERKQLRRYLLGEKLVIRKEMRIVIDEKSGKSKLDVAFHGYIAEPKEWWLSVEKVVEQEGARPKWAEIAEKFGILEYVKTPEGKVDKKSYEQGVGKILVEREDIEYDEPKLADAKALGFQQNLLRLLPEFYLLPAITDYSDEIDKRSSSTVFRRLMGQLSDRILKADPRYQELEGALRTIKNLLNPAVGAAGAEQGQLRMPSLAAVENQLRELIARLMPSVKHVQVEVAITETQDLFSSGVALQVDDGVLTDVLDKGHGLQRSVVFGLLQMLIKNSRNEQKDQGQQGAQVTRPILLAIEEPELYIHPQSQRLIYHVLEEFGSGQLADGNANDQVIYSTHSPAFLSVSDYERVAIVRKTDAAVGSKVLQCDAGVLGDVHEKKAFKLLNSFDLRHNQLFFAQRVVLVEGEQDDICIVATGRKLGLFKEFPEEVGFSIIVTGNKEEIPKFQKVLNAFGVNYATLLEMDGKPEDEGKNAEILALAGGNRVVQLPKTMEDAAGLANHFKDTHQCVQYFLDPARITAELEAKVAELLQ
jgi:putative ATP-dependent endonuclease of the OLD family